MKYRILALGAGGLSGLSGVHENLFSALAKKHELVGVIDTRLSGFWKYWNLLYCFWRLPGFSKYLHPVRTVLGGEISDYRQQTKYYALKRTEAGEYKILNFSKSYDIIIQTTYIPLIRAKPAKPRCIFVDFTIKLTEREYPLWETFLSEVDKRKWLEWEVESYQNATIVFTASNHTRDSIINDYGIDEEKVVTIYEGANIKELPTFEKDYSNKTILFVGRDFDRKGGQSLIKAFKEVKKEIKDAKMIIAGQCSPAINVQDITVEGYVDHQRLLQLYEQASIFAMPSVCEPFGIVFLEAMTYKTPCIGSTADAMPEIIEDGKTGFLIPPNDYQQLADKLILLLEDENLMKRMGERSRKRFEKYFTWDLVVERMTKKFEKIDV
jgi:glycosyltransferase involved in cell wall biosynthesis